jgi:RNA polymerase sigma-70 factor, ECF subfamily
VIALIDARPLPSIYGPFVRRGDPVLAATAETDEELMHRYQRGNDDAFRQLYQRHRSGLHRFVKRQSPKDGDTEEIVQETWMAVIQSRGNYRPQARFVTFLFSIARRRTIDRWRKIGRTPELESDTEELDQVLGPATNEPELTASTEALRGDLLAAIAMLPLLQRETFLLHAEGALTLEEIATVTGTSRETAKSRLRYALNRLRSALEPWHD